MSQYLNQKGELKFYWIRFRNIKSFPKINTQYKFKNYVFTIEGIDNKRIK